MPQIISTMETAAEQAGEARSLYPATACPVAARFINSSETALTHPQRQRLTAIAPELQNTREPAATGSRLDRLVELAISSWAPAALEAAGHPTLAAVLRDEPETARAATLAFEFAAALDAEVPSRPASQAHRTSLHAMKATRHASRAARQLQESDWTIRQHAAQSAAFALAESNRATGADQVEELLSTIRLIINILPGTGVSE